MPLTNIFSVDSSLGGWHKVKLVCAAVAAIKVPKDPLEAVSSKTSLTATAVVLQVAVPAELNVNT